MKIYFKILDSVENTILFISFTAMLTITFLNVLVRFFTTFSFAFTEELVPPLFILVTMVGAGAVARRGGHIGLSMVTDRLSANKRFCVTLLVALICIVFGVLITYQGFLMTLNQFQRNMMTPAMRWPQWIFGAFVPIGGFFMTLGFINFTAITITTFVKNIGRKAGVVTEGE